MNLKRNINFIAASFIAGGLPRPGLGLCLYHHTVTHYRLAATVQNNTGDLHTDTSGSLLPKPETFLQWWKTDPALETEFRNKKAHNRKDISSGKEKKKKSERNNTQHQGKSNYSHPSWTVLYYVLLKYSSWDLKSLNTSAYTAEPVAEYLFSSLHILFLRLFYFSSIPTFQLSFCT